MLGTSWECHKVREFALRPMGDFLLVLDHSPFLHYLLVPSSPKSILGIQVTKTTLTSRSG